MAAARETLQECSFKVLGDRCESNHGGTGTWRKGQWRIVTGDIVPCRNGIHYCRPEQLVAWLGPTIWLFEDGTPDETVDAGDKMVTRKGRVVEQLTTWNARTARLFAADCAETALRFIPGSHQEPFVAAINAARGFARGEISNKKRAAAAARAAAEAAARDAARDAAEAAAEAAAWAAAWDAAEAAARDAAWAAAEAAERAAEAAARDAARAAARRSQIALLFEYLSGEKS